MDVDAAIWGGKEHDVVSDILRDDTGGALLVKANPIDWHFTLIIKRYDRFFHVELGIGITMAQSIREEVEPFPYIPRISLGLALFEITGDGST